MKNVYHLQAPFVSGIEPSSHREHPASVHSLQLYKSAQGTHSPNSACSAYPLKQLRTVEVSSSDYPLLRALRKPPVSPTCLTVNCTYKHDSCSSLLPVHKHCPFTHIPLMLQWLSHTFFAAQYRLKSLGQVKVPIRPTGAAKTWDGYLQANTELPILTNTVDPSSEHWWV